MYHVTLFFTRIWKDNSCVKLSYNEVDGEVCTSRPENYETLKLKLHFLNPIELTLNPIEPTWTLLNLMNVPCTLMNLHWTLTNLPWTLMKLPWTLMNLREPYWTKSEPSLEPKQVMGPVLFNPCSLPISTGGLESIIKWNFSSKFYTQILRDFL